MGLGPEEWAIIKMMPKAQGNVETSKVPRKRAKPKVRRGSRIKQHFDRQRAHPNG